MENRLRRYVLKRLDKRNVKRSLIGAANRSFDGSVCLSFATKSARLPDKYEQHKLPGGGAYMEVSSQGQFSSKNFLKIVISGRSPIDNAIFIDNAGIKLREINGSVSVCYWEAI